ncbi:hypothetical protein [Spiroplasma endosymbiont of Dasysyrphus albostriatus]|uniref:hypothetical protein n=1 Tax=Spiroplasma endosymbiont of Dasysyrphus albostriatus TaxID=3066299 RepID=UPI0030CC1398
MQLSNKEQELLSTYQNWLKENNLSDKCNVNFIEANSILVFQTWNLEEIISETLWLKTDNKKWQFDIKTLGEKFNQYFSLKEILKSFNENRTSNCA